MSINAITKPFVNVRNAFALVLSDRHEEGQQNRWLTYIPGGKIVSTALDIRAKLGEPDFSEQAAALKVLESRVAEARRLGIAPAYARAYAENPEAFNNDMN